METTKERIERIITNELHPAHLDVINESSKHNVPSGSESHFKLVIVADIFEGHSLLQRHKRINTLLAAELTGGVHALSLNTLTPTEWADKGNRVENTPPCLGGSDGQ